MIALERAQASRTRIMRLAVGLALFAALFYLMIQMKVLTVGDLQASEGPDGIVYVCAGSYLLGGLLILLRWRWLWTAGAVVNALVMLFFFSAYASRPSVMFSPGGMATKAAQLLLEVVLIYLIVTQPGRPAPRR